MDEFVAEGGNLLGDEVEVRLMEVAPIKGGMRFEILSGGKPGEKPKRLPKRQPKKWSQRPPKKRL